MSPYEVQAAAILENCPKHECPICSGSGKIQDDVVVGSQLRTLRMASNVSLREVARRLHLSAPYVSDLELGHRAWSNPRIVSYLEAISDDYTPPKEFTL